MTDADFEAMLARSVPDENRRIQDQRCEEIDRADHGDGKAAAELVGLAGGRVCPWRVIECAGVVGA